MAVGAHEAGGALGATEVGRDGEAEDRILKLGALIVRASPVLHTERAVQQGAACNIDQHERADDRWRQKGTTHIIDIVRIEQLHVALKHVDRCLILFIIHYRHA
jgi:hypothetical protein